MYHGPLGPHGAGAHNNLVENVTGPMGPMGLGPIFLIWRYFKYGSSRPIHKRNIFQKLTFLIIINVFDRSQGVRVPSISKHFSKTYVFFVVLVIFCDF